MQFSVAVGIILILNIILAFRFRKRIKIVNIALIGLMVFFLSSVRDGPDIQNYITRFSSEIISIKDITFSLLSVFFYKIGWNYFQFQTFIYIVCLTVICQSMIRVFEKRTIIYVLYIIFPLLLNAVQIRNMIAAALLVFGVCVCFDEKKIVKQRIKWCVIFAAAASVHVAMILYIPFIFLLGHEKTIRTGVKVFFVVAILIYISPDVIINILSKAASIIDSSSRVSDYMQRSTRLGGFVMMLEAILLYYFAKKSEKYCLKQNYLELHETEVAYCSFMRELLLYSLMFIPLYVLNGNFFRLVQNASILIYGIYSITHHFNDYAVSGTPIIRIRKETLMATCLAFAVLLYNVISFWIGNFDLVVRPLLFGS